MNTNARSKARGEKSESQKSESRVSRDAFFRGGFEVLQPVGTGHRAGSDALLLAAGLPQNATGKVADLGSGVGVAGLAAIAANPELETVLVEIDGTMADLARESLKLPANAEIASRASVLQADVTLSGEDRRNAGLEDDTFDYVIMNPPYDLASDRASPDDLRSLAHQMGEGGLDPWLRTAAAILKPVGTLVMIWRTERLGDVLAGTQGRFGNLSIVPLHAHEGKPAGRMVIRAYCCSKAPLSLLPGITLHEADGSQTEMADALLNGNARLPFIG